MRRTLLLFALGYALAALGSWVNVAHAQTPALDITFKWMPPVLYVDQRPIPSSTPITYNVYSGPKAGTRVKVAAVSTAQYTMRGAPLDTCVQVTAVIAGQGEAAKSDELCVSSAIPQKATNLQWVSIVVQEAKP